MVCEHSSSCKTPSSIGLAAAETGPINQQASTLYYYYNTNHSAQHPFNTAIHMIKHNVIPMAHCTTDIILRV